LNELAWNRGCKEPFKCLTVLKPSTGEVFLSAYFNDQLNQNTTTGVDDIGCCLCGPACPILLPLPPPNLASVGWTGWTGTTGTTGTTRTSTTGTATVYDPTHFLLSCSSGFATHSLHANVCVCKLLATWAPTTILCSLPSLPSWQAQKTRSTTPYIQLPVQPSDI
jgi:hypothetical protein